MDDNTSVLVGILLVGVFLYSVLGLVVPGCERDQRLSKVCEEKSRSAEEFAVCVNSTRESEEPSK